MVCSRKLTKQRDETHLIQSSGEVAKALFTVLETLINTKDDAATDLRSNEWKAVPGIWRSSADKGLQLLKMNQTRNVLKEYFLIVSAFDYMAMD
ncbi:hypothetical protein Bca4012_058799 [Brassica carinata]|uniref:Uncharacterized protein n=1 Tax=Brassica carinata TaxID=52824 RepID=A0A8X7W585_BRACI|nr:hypothetical protein Bca52824_016525 [Brassica carinata]